MKLLRAHHLHDEALVDTYLLARAGTPVAPRIAEHLVDCRACSRRYAEFARMLDEARTAADADVDEIFPAERLRTHRLRIVERLANCGRSARVLTFPISQPSRGLTMSRPRIATRWIAAAAAAGLFAGVGVGVFFDHSRVQTTVADLHQSQQAPVTVTTGRAPAAASVPQETDDETFLTDLDLALESPHTRILVVYDRLTPHVRDISDVR